MKTNILFAIAISTGLLVTACDPSPNRENTKEVAEEQNEDRIDATTGNDATTDNNTTGNNTTGNKDDKENDAEFMVEAASGGMMEVELANLALQKGTSTQVKEFARMMIKDHKKANEELKALAASKNIVLPTALIDKHQRVVNDLKDKSVKTFDAKYMNAMLDDHKKDVKEFEEASKDAADPDIRAFAAKTLPVLQEHLRMADKYEDLTDKM